MTSIPNASQAAIIQDLADVIVANKAWLSEIDGKIGDGDHGSNMAKGFSRAADRIAGQDITLDAGLLVLSDVLMSEIGGSMGPLYGLMFADMAGAMQGHDRIDADLFSAALNAGLQAVQGVGNAKVGDKTLVDALAPAVAAFDAAMANGFAAALDDMAHAAEAGRDSTIDLVAKIGRSSRLGERSRGVLDAGATSCCLILTSLGQSVRTRLS
ncbi:MAG: dihydroxyacetone kinase subunit DhaL [Pseudotabrizicola sp.]|uniref:dihydroxyacetone kinase subunit DhaL n=1 Tax=Pseudotabrizicola sp. TaxID=2939647 RepID=UPI00272FBEE4|nr:dihydroxyacetone kinase subunit DhaL [Pseudotabrizicola sp.]MDP2079607.1 dihydroxyacetone kinase subunit DhaL [Pseudotabrizicola sp.]MDZ7576376.1 dihydroxyacetone kinase subunit DhaL [Pseudotabrizicola sp.]